MGLGPEGAPLWFELAVILSAIGLGAFVKGVTGAGLPQISIPVIAIFLGVERAVVIMAIPGVVTNMWMMWDHRAAVGQTRDLPVLLVAGTVGTVVGTMGLTLLDPALLGLALATVGALYVVLRLVRVEVLLTPRLTRVASPPLGLFAGLLQGSTGVSGPLVTTYLAAYRLPRAPFVFSIVTLFNVFSIAQVVALIGLGLYTPSRVIESLLALIPIALLLPLGSRYATRLSQERFERYLFGLIALSVIVLTSTSLRALLG